MRLEKGIIFLLLAKVTMVLAATTCRVRDGKRLAPHYFSVITCRECFTYLFQGNEELTTDRYSFNFIPVNGSKLYPPNTKLYPNITDPEARSLICKALSADECTRWTQCCNSAIECCQRQLKNVPEVTSLTGEKCPMTWDGYACWEELEPGSGDVQDCPSFIPYVIPGVKAEKNCTENATWWRRPENNKEYTNYAVCLDLSTEKIAVLVSTACYLTSIVSLVPAMVIFIYYKTLLLQHRIRIHLNLFLAFVMNALVQVIWNLVVVYDKLTKENTESVLYGNSMGCKLLSTLKRYFEDTGFVWMFCEGLYLHQLLNNTFRPQQSILGYYIFGWAFALLPTLAFAIIRKVLFDGDCWMKNIGHYEWLHYAPNLAAIVFNFIFLINILRILLTQLQAHPNEPSNYRRALKATFILVPLFGLQWLLTIYRPGEADTQANTVVNIAHQVITGLQGLFVALIFCYFNGEVVQQLKRSCPCLVTGRGSDRGPSSMSTQYTMDVSRTETPVNPTRQNAVSPSPTPASPSNGAVKPISEGNYIQLAQLENGKPM